MSGLRRLTIESYGLIERAEIDFADGATMFTGETGSGKTMILGALGFVLGGRAAAESVRRGASKAVASLEFEPDETLRVRMADDGFDTDPGEAAVLSREITENGKSNIRLNGRPVTSGYVRDLAGEIADVVGQHDAQRLLQAAYHVEILDRFAGAHALELRTNVSRLHGCARDLDSELQTFDAQARHAHEQSAFASFALAEIEKDDPDPQEESRLHERRTVLDNVEKITQALRVAHDALAGGERAASDRLGETASSQRAIADMSSELRELGDAAATLQSEAGDLSVRIARALDASDFEPRELETINARLDVLDRLKRKYGGTIEAVLRTAAEFRSTLSSEENRDQRRSAILSELDAARQELAKTARQLSKTRRGAAKALQERVAAEFADLALGGARFDVRFTDLPEVEAAGSERIEFVFSANTGEPERALSRVASGGELSRLLLAMVVASTSGRVSSALVFDEIDAGIGGATATAVGTRLGRLAAAGQVLCVTHLAQIASWADRHYVLEKRETRHGAQIEVRNVATSAERAAELARMLSGEAQDVALRHARALLTQTGKLRTTLS
ncbi:MAG: DNA repair protein RecN [Candidatus Eremiobacteraeota bacterium]|nr:DNA repair protein RecN [Candidatus Eremiobacteraeota bacterium]